MRCVLKHDADLYAMKMIIGHGCLPVFTQCVYECWDRLPTEADPAQYKQFKWIDGRC